jgi:hypothetical protein
MVLGPSLSPTTEAALITWGAQKRALYRDRDQPIASQLGQIKRDRNAAGAGDARLRQRWAEVYRGDAVAVQRIVLHLRELPRTVVTYHYLLRPYPVTATELAAALDIKKRDYWRHLELATAAVDSGLQLLAMVAEANA